MVVFEQCETCPWRFGSRLSDIPGYDFEKHKLLVASIASGSWKEQLSQEFFGMLCHYDRGEDILCAGWAHNQVNNNNILLRLRQARNKEDYVVHGPQKKTFEETLQNDCTN
jgi:Family of unknown function (DUF6283)